MQRRFEMYRLRDDVDPKIVAQAYEPYEPDEAFWSKVGAG